jgi:hypothetical protein
VELPNERKNKYRTQTGCLFKCTFLINNLEGELENGKGNMGQKSWKNVGFIFLPSISSAFLHIPPDLSRRVQNVHEEY